MSMKISGAECQGSGIGIGCQVSPVKFATLLFSEKFNGAPITGFPFHYNKQRAGVKIYLPIIALVPEALELFSIILLDQRAL